VDPSQTRAFWCKKQGRVGRTAPRAPRLGIATTTSKFHVRFGKLVDFFIKTRVIYCSKNGFWLVSLVYRPIFVKFSILGHGTSSIPPPDMDETRARLATKTDQNSCMPSHSLVHRPQQRCYALVAYICTYYTTCKVVSNRSRK
jgi:hypothetical protein